MIESELEGARREPEPDTEVVRRLEELQDKFEAVMSHLSSFDEEGDESIRAAKEEFRRIVRRYRDSRNRVQDDGLH